MELEDLIADYPLVEDVPDFQAMMQEKQEFFELAAKEHEAPPDPYFNHQLLFQRMMSVYDICLNISEAGTGKTCSFAVLAEYCKNHLPHIKRAIVVCGKKQLQDFRKQLVMKCTNGVYITEGVRKARNQTGKSKAMTHALKDFYTFYTYEELDRECQEKYPMGKPYWDGEHWIIDQELIDDSNRKIREDFSGTLVLFDEIHFKRIEQKKHRFVTENNERVISRRLREWLTIWRIAHLPYRNKVLFFTATPVTNTGSEMIYLLNLIYPADKQLWSSLMEDIIEYAGLNVEWQDSPDWETRRDKQEMIDDYVGHFANNLSGKVLFVATTQQMAKISYIPIEQPTIPADSWIGKNLEWYREFSREKHSGTNYSPMERIRPLPMMGIQRDRYLAFSDPNVEVDDEPEGDPLFQSTRSICIGVFPDGSFGNAGMFGKNSKNEVETTPWVVIEREEVRISDKQTRVIERYRPNPEKIHDGYDLAYWYSNHLNLFSCKMYYIVTGAMYLPYKRYVVSTYLSGSGAYLLGIALECAVYFDLKTKKINPSKKFTRYFGIEPTFEPSGLAEEDSPDESDRNILLSEGYRYAIISGETSESDVANIFSLYNHPHNADGRYLKVIIISKVGQTGINLLDTVYVDFLDIPWSPGTQYQAERRVVRIEAHKILERILRRRTEVEVGILIPLLVNDDGSPVMLNGRERNTVDLSIYLRTSDRSERNSVPYRALKIVAADNRIQRKRNVFNPSLSYTPEADYMDTNYPCLGWDGQQYSYVNCSDRTRIDTSTYDVFYQDVIVEKNMVWIKQFYNRYLFATIDEIYYVLRREPDYVANNVVNRKYILITLKHIVKNDTRLIDPFGYQCFLRESHGIFHLTRTDSRSDIMSDETTIYYNSNIVAVRYREFKEIVSDIYYGKSFNLFTEIISNDNPVENYIRMTQNIGINELIGLVELVTRKYRDDLINIIEYNLNPVGKTPITGTLANLMYDKYLNQNIFVIHEPTQHIRAIAESISRKKPNTSVLFGLYDRNSQPNFNETVIVHSFYSLVQNITTAGSSTKFKEADFRIRILRLSEGVWRDPNKAESYAYRKFLSDRYVDAETALENRFPRHYAKYIRHNCFLIVHKEYESFDAAINGVKQFLGKDIYSYNAAELLYFMWQLGINIPDRTMYVATENEKRRFLASSGEPNPFGGKWVWVKGQTNSLPSDFVDFCYDFFYMNKVVAPTARRYKNSLCLRIVEKYIETGRVLEAGGLNVIDYYRNRLTDLKFYGLK